MSEGLRYRGDHEKAYDFIEQHILPPLDYSEYVERQLEQWEQSGRQHPFWMRTDNTDPFSGPTYIHYLASKGEQFVPVATIKFESEVGGESLRVLIPDQRDQSKTVEIFYAAYTLRSVEQALELVEHSELAA